MNTAAEYRLYADECLTAMRAALIPEVRAALFTAAQRWTALADQCEKEDLPASPYDLRTPPGGARAPAGT